MDDLEGEVVGEEVYEGGFGEDIFSADLNCEDALLLNIRVDCIFGVTHNVGCFISSNGIGKILKSLFNMCAELVLNIILSVAVLGILITAPLGAILMDSTKNKLLK